MKDGDHGKSVEHDLGWLVGSADMSDGMFATSLIHIEHLSKS